MAGGEWRMANGEWRMANGEWRMANGEWRMGEFQSSSQESVTRQPIANIMAGER
jgi:hypothetical protein